MLKDEDEIRIVSSALEPGIREPLRRASHFPNILSRFMRGVSFAGARILDLGPGHFDFADSIVARGATVVGLDFDPAVLALGRKRGHEAHTFDFTKDSICDRFGPAAFDGVFCNGSINCWWFRDGDAHERFVADVVAALRPGGWSYIAPCNYMPGHSIATAGKTVEGRAALDAQVAAFAAHGFRTVIFNRLHRRTFGMSTNMNPAYVFTRNLDFTHWPI